MQEHRYRAFLCYSHRDSAWADWLHDALETYAIPPRLVGLATSAGAIPPHLRPVFRDRDELPSATDLSAKVQDALAQSACLIVICSPHAAQSRWVDEEVRSFRRLGRGDRIYCLIVDGEPGASAWPGREHDECLPSALKSPGDGDGENAQIIEPIAADARPNGDGKTNAKLKLIAGLLGVGLDDLRHRERKRRRWRRVIAGAVALALLCLTTTLAVNAVIARHAAERRQKQAEDLVGFMLGDLDDKLREVNRLDILESVADKAVKYFSALPVADVNDATLAQGATALQKIGRVRFDQGRMQEAESAFNTARSTALELVRRQPRNAGYVSIEAKTFVWLGRVSWARGELDAALQRFREALSCISTLAPDQQASTDILDLSGTLRTNTGRILEARGDLKAARVEYAAVLALYEQLVARERDNVEWKAELGYAHNNLGQIASKDGLLDETIREYGADLRIKTTLAALDPTNNARREDLLISQAVVGKSLATVGETVLAEKYMRAAVAGSEKLLELDASVTSWQEDSGYYSMMLAALARVSGNSVDSTRYGEIALTRLTRLVAQEPNNVSWIRDIAEAEIEAAQRKLAQHRNAEASTLAASAEARMGELIKRDSANRANSRILARARIAIGDAAVAQGNVSAARAAWQSAESDTRELATRSSDPAWLDVQATSLLRLGKLASAKPLLEKLESMGYRAPDLVMSANAASMTLTTTTEAGLRIASAVARLPESPMEADVRGGPGNGL
jgi:tetratricopeptide (TPR) repeat protein